MNDEIILPASSHININLGLKYLNGNRKLYKTVLKSFLSRYQTLNVHELQEEELQSTLHALKGLSATLGMETLSTLAKDLQDINSKELLEEFSITLQKIITDLSNNRE